MQVCNVAVSLKAPLQYPSGIVPGSLLPKTKKDFRSLSGRLYYNEMFWMSIH